MTFHPPEHEDGLDGDDDEGEQNGSKRLQVMYLYLNNDDQELLYIR